MAGLALPEFDVSDLDGCPVEELEQRFLPHAKYMAEVYSLFNTVVSLPGAKDDEISFDTIRYTINNWVNYLNNRVVQPYVSALAKCHNNSPDQ